MFVERMEVLEYRQKFEVELTLWARFLHDYYHWNAFQWLIVPLSLQIIISESSFIRRFIYLQS